MPRKKPEAATTPEKPPRKRPARPAATPEPQTPPEPAPAPCIPSAAIVPPCKACIIATTCTDFREADGSTCVVAEREQAQTTAAVMALEHIQDTDRPMVEEYAKVTVALKIIDAYLAHTGPFLPGADRYIDIQPVLKQRQSLSTSLVKLSTELGLTPAARQRLKLGSKSEPEPARIPGGYETAPRSMLLMMAQRSPLEPMTPPAEEGQKSG